MHNEKIKQMIGGPLNYDESQEETLRAWLKDGFSKRMRWVMVLVNMGYLGLTALIVFSIVKFFQTDQTGSQILYASVFLMSNLWVGFLSVFGWVMMQRPGIRREMKWLELRIAELISVIKDK